MLATGFSFAEAGLGTMLGQWMRGYGKGDSTWTNCDCSAIPLCAAAQDGELERVRDLIADGDDVDEQDKYGGTALRRAAEIVRRVGPIEPYFGTP